ncbi:MAG TPA: hypothetical protein VGZ29_16470 [Terriglobia bacterium]|nr:hypothetical protein [Terriglobia bacterium]
MAAKKNEYKVKLKMGDTEVEVEGAESGVVKIVQALSEVIRGPRRTSASTPLSVQPGGSLVPVSSAQKSAGHTDIRSFFEEKKPSSDIEAAAVASYYYQYLASQPRDTIDAVALQEAFRLARRPLPARTIYTLTNARNAGYLDSTGEGEFRLNPVGYNLVEHGLGPSAGDEETKPKKKRRRQQKK